VATQRWFNCSAEQVWDVLGDGWLYPLWVVGASRIRDVDDGWPAEPDESGAGITAPFNAPSQGPPPWNVYRIEPRSAIVTLAAEPGGLTRFRF